MGLEPRFNCYIGIDYSGAETPESSCRGGLRIYAGEGSGTQEQVPPRKCWRLSHFNGFARSRFWELLRGG
jgi:hypothetical protein